MRRLAALALSFSIITLLLGTVAQAQMIPGPIPIPFDPPPTIDGADTSELTEFRLFFLHLANLDLAADQAEAAGNPPDASSWRSFEQHTAGLTEQEGAILKDVAYRCNQAIRDHEDALEAAGPSLTAGESANIALPPPPVEESGITQTLSAAVDELRMLLSPEAFGALAQRVHDLIGSATVEVPIGGPGTTPPVSSESVGIPEIPIEPLADRPAMSALSLVIKLPDGFFMAECATTPKDDVTFREYASGVTPLCLLHGIGALPVTIPIGCAVPSKSSLCMATFPRGVPGQQFLTQAVHGVRMIYSETCPFTGGPRGLHDPLRYCNAGQQHVIDVGEILASLGPPACWQGYPQVEHCVIGTSTATPIAYIDVSPRQSTIASGAELQLNASYQMQARWSVLNGIGTIVDLGEPQTTYTAPDSISSTQSATIRACDLYEPSDCVLANVTVVPLTVDVTKVIPPGSPEPPNEVLPEGEIQFKATVNPSGQKVEWSASPAGAMTASEDTFTGTYKAPRNADLPPTPTTVTISGCVKARPSAQPVCDTAQVTVPKIQFFISGATHDLLPNQTVQLTAVVQGSSLVRKVKWDVPFVGTLTPVDSSQSLEDTLVVLYKAPPTHQGSGIGIKACLKDSPSFCDIWPVNFLADIDVTSLTPDTGSWNAGALTPFTVTGIGFGTDPTRVSVTFGSVPAVVTLVTGTRIQGVVPLPVSLGGQTFRPEVTVIFPNGDDNIFTKFPITIVRANLGVSPGTADLHAGDTQPFSAICFAPAAPCTSPENPTWTATAGTVEPTTGLNVTYRAPASVTANTTATVNACWGVGYCATAAVTLRPPAGPVVTVTPPTVALGPAGTQDFNAEVANSPNPNVTWSLQPPSPQGGSITPDGLYTAPTPFAGALTVTVTATSVADPTKEGAATVTLIPAPLTLTSTPSPVAVRHGTLITWTATATGGLPGTLEYALFRKKVGTPDWIPARTSPSWQTSNELKWTPSSTETGDWEIEIWVKDAATPANANTHGYAASHNPGPVKVVAPLSISCTPSPASAPHGLPITWTVTPSGGVPGTIQYAFFRRRSGTSDWIPNPSSPAWQGNNVLTWIPILGDVGAWDTFIWARDSLTPPNQNTYGYSTSCNPGSVQVVVPINLASTPSPAVVQHGTTVTWTATATGGVQASIQYALFRRKIGTADWVPARTSPQWQPSNILSWATVLANVGDWEIEIWVKDGTTPPTANGHGYAASHNPGPVKVVAPLSIACTPSPASASQGVPITWTVTPNGGVPGTIQYAFFRRRSGTTTWIPDPSNPGWQANNTLSWTPTATDVGTWDTYIWAKDSLTSPSQNGHGYAASCNPGPVQVMAALNFITTPSPAVAYYGSPITWTATATGGTGTGRQYALFRKKAGNPNWTPDVTSPAWQTDNTLSWTPAAGDVGTWEIIIWAKDSATPPNMNTYGYAAYYNAGPVQVVAPLTVSGTGSPAKYYRGNPITWTATASGGTGTGRQYALFRKLAGATSWTPDVTSPAWQAGNTMTWTPGAGDAGTWEIVIWARDSATPPTMNTYGFAAYYNAGPMQVFAPPALTITPSPASSTPGTPLTWTVTVSGGITPATYQYALFRRPAGTSTWTPSPSSPNWQASNILSWNPGPGDTGTWEIYVWVKDNHTPATMNTYGYAAGSGAGSVEIVGPPTLTCPVSPPSANTGTTITWTVPASGGVPGTIQYALLRRRVGTASWIPSVTSPAWQTSNVLAWTPGSGDVGVWEFQILIRDANTPPNNYAASCNPGSVQVLAPLTVTGTGSPGSANHGTVISWTATASGGTGTGRQYALFRKKAGTLNWIPAVTSPAWQTSPVLSWIPTADDVDTWEIIIWAKDSATPPTMNTYGFAAYYNAGPVEVTVPLYQSHAPIGWVDGYDRQHIWGWACDPDYPTESNRVDIWTTSWQYLGSADAYFGSSSPINSACGGGWAHYFDFHHNGGIPPGTHFMVWSIDLPYATPGNDNRPLGGNGSIGDGTEFVIP